MLHKSIPLGITKCDFFPFITQISHHHIHVSWINYLIYVHINESPKTRSLNFLIRFSVPIYQDSLDLRCDFFSRSTHNPNGSLFSPVPSMAILVHSGCDLDNNVSFLVLEPKVLYKQTSFTWLYCLQWKHTIDKNSYSTILILPLIRIWDTNALSCNTPNLA